jgi:5-methylcytosine-specific restriction endonuclease McrA
VSRPCLVCGVVTQGSRCPAHQRPGAAHKAAYNDTAYRRARAVVRATGPACWLCGRPGADTLDHVTPLAAGGANVPSNWAPAHKGCNSRRGATAGVAGL